MGSGKIFSCLRAGVRRIGRVRDYLICYGKIVFGVLDQVSGSILRLTFKFPSFVFGVCS